MSKTSFSRMVEAGAAHTSSARHQRRAAEAEARKDGAGLSLPAMKKLIRRNNQKKGKS